MSPPKESPGCPVDHTQFAANFNPFRPDFIADPYPSFKQAREEQPVFYSPVMDTWLVTRYEDLKTVMKDVESFSSAGSFTAASSVSPEAFRALGGLEHPILKYALINTDAPLHTRLRASIQRAFTTRQVERLEPQIRVLIRELLSPLRLDKRADLVNTFCNQLPLLTICRLLGVPDADAGKIQLWSGYFAEILIPGLGLERQRIIGQGLRDFYDFMFALVEKYNLEPAENLISSIIETRKAVEEPLTDEEVAGVACSVVFAGHETTAKLIGNMLHNVLTRRDLWDDLRGHPERLGAATDEFVRHDTSIIGLYRRTTREVVLGDVAIPKDATVWVTFSAGNHDPEQFPEPEKLDFHRSNAGTNLSFGFGAHFCPGAPLTRLELRLVLEELTTNYPTLRLDPDQKPEFSDSFVLRSYRELAVTTD